jgi:hypothetical protein
MANGDAPAAAPDIPHFDTRFVVQTPDGSTATQVLRTDRPISTDELTAHLAQQGHTFIGYPETPPPAPPAAATPPAAPAEAAPAEFHPTAAQRAAGIFVPQRSYKSQLPSIGGATVGATVGGMTGPFAPVASPVLAAVGSGLGEAGDIAYEKLTGSAPAEPAPAWERIQNAAIRGGAYETLAAPVAYAARPVMTALKPIAAAVGDLLPVLQKTLPAGVQAVENTATGVARSIDQLIGHSDQEVVSKVLANPSLQLSPDGQLTLLQAWWQRQASQAPEQIAHAWETLSGTAQAKLAGALREPMQTIINTLKTGQDIPALRTALFGGSGAGTATLGYVFGHPVAGVVAAAPSVVKAAGEAVPAVASRMLQNPTGAAVLSWLPRAAQVAAPLARAGLQSVGTFEWPLASTLTPGPTPGP